MLYFIFFIIFVALVFDFLNGFHDAANSIATIVSTRVLTPAQAVVWAAFFNFVAAFIFGTQVAATIGNGLVDPHAIDIYVIVAWIFRPSTPSRVDGMLRRLQLLSAAIYSLGHGGNDAQKTMGVIVMLLVAANYGHWTTPDPHSWANAFNVFGHHHNIAWWIILSCHFAIATGTMFGGWRIVKTMGSSITRLQPVGGFCAETAAAFTIIAATRLGVPISTTHAITGSIIGVGTTKGVRSVRWIWGERIVIAWVLTLPCSAFMAAVVYLIVHVGVEPFLK